MIDIKIISQRGQSALVEYIENGQLERRIVLANDIHDGQVNEYNINLGVQYGLKWSKLITLQATSEDLEQNLRRVGIWTGEDALTNVEKLLSAIQRTYKVDLGVLLRIAKEAK